MAKIALLSCTKSKLSYSCPAKELYSPSRWFPLAYEYVRKIGAERVYILSALYGLVPEDQIISPYEKTLNDASYQEKRAWANKVITDLRQVSDLANDEFIIIAGRNYYEYLLPYLKHTTIPLKGQSIFYWVPKLKELLNATPSMATEIQSNNKHTTGHSLGIHQVFNSLPRFHFPFDQTKIPGNGIYIMFEAGEKYRNLDRIVRVGTHTSQNRLRARLKDHYITENKDGSIFRKNIGRALLNQQNDPFLPEWDQNQSRINDPDILKRIDWTYMKSVEKSVSKHLRENISFVTIEVENADDRLRLEEGIIATLNNDPDFISSPNWLGRFSPKTEIRNSGMWLVQGLDAAPLTNSEVVKVTGFSRNTVNIASSPSQTLKPSSVSHNPSFEPQLRSLFQEAKTKGYQYLDVVSGDLHRLVGGYPGQNHKMPTCCQVMYRNMKPGDQVLYSPPSGKGATLKIRYFL